ncbi:MFS transporter [Microbulbifer sp. 2201CG32-9]|uniref:MFS transporter n=1 Tax=Microbulbifer sp. 2201CG32-9 TaxID=3232309 RepID=UPI00345C070C
MSDAASVSTTGDLSTQAIFDRPRTITAAVVISIVGNAVFIGMPMLVGAMAESLGFDEQQLGWLASADLFGIFVASITTSLLLTRINRQWMALFGIALAIANNYLSTTITDFESLVVVRVLSGIGGGVCYALGVATLAGSHHTGRNYSILLFALVAVNAIELYTFPSISDRWGVNGIFLFFCAAFALVAAFVQWLPARGIETAAGGEEVAATDSGALLYLPRWVPWVCLAAVSAVYINVGAFWAFIERAGVDANLSDDFIANTLALGTLFTLSGCAIATWLSNRYGQSKPLLWALAIMTVLLVGLALDINPVSYVIGATLFNFMWLFIDIFQLGTLGNIDHSGRYAALVPAAQGLTQSVAPAVAGYILVSGSGYGGVMLLCAFGTSLAWVCYRLVYRTLRQATPDVADAS